jgi:peptide deformylase
MGHPVLLQKCEPVKDPGGPEIRRLVADMMETMEDAAGAGLAAPQVHVPLRLFVFRVASGRTEQDPDDVPLGNSVLINPELELLGEECVLGWEGCLSIPGMRAAVPRAGRVRYRGVDCDGLSVERRHSNDPAGAKRRAGRGDRSHAAARAVRWLDAGGGASRLGVDRGGAGGCRTTVPWRRGGHD